MVASTSRLSLALTLLPTRGGGLPLDTGVCVDVGFFPEDLDPAFPAEACLGVACLGVACLGVE